MVLPKRFFAGLLGLAISMSPFWLSGQSNPNATKNTTDLYSFLTYYKSNPDHCLLLGQSIGHKNQAFDLYDPYITTIKNETGSAPAILEVNIGLEGAFDQEQVAQLFMDYAEDGGIVSVTWQALNPWSGTYYVEDPNRFRDFNRLINPQDSLAAVWKKELDSVAHFLQLFNDRDIPVLWRPFPDMNGTWYWWGSNLIRPEEDFQRLWQHMYNYFTDEKGLDNLLWVFSVNQSTILSNTPGDWLKGDTYYPGSNYVDVVGLTIFDEALVIKDNQDFFDLKKFSKPLAITLCGPDPSRADGSYNYLNIFNAFNEKYPEIAYATVAHSYAGVKLALVDNLNYDQLFDQSCILHQGDFDVTEDWTPKDHLLDDVQIFPIPTEDYFSISSNHIISDVIRLELVDMSGKIWFVDNFENAFHTEVYLPYIPSGLYLLNLTLENDNKQFKLVIQH